MMHVGFAIIVGHSVDPHIISDLSDVAKSFLVQDEGTKKFYNHGPYGNSFGGYTGMNSKAVSCMHDKHGSDGGVRCTDHKNDGGSFVMVPDLVKSFVFKPGSTMPKPPELKEVGMTYHESLLHVRGALHKLTAASLG